MPLLGTRAGASANGYGLFSGGKPVVTGGTLTSDATYYYRTFLSNGTLTVTNGSLGCEILVVSGGGAGGAAQDLSSPFNILIGSGGGAGGLKVFTPTLSPSNYTVTIGAGGSATVGSNSSLGASATTGGGFFQTNGGSGGGNGYWNNGTVQPYNAGAGIAGEGNAGGNGFNGIVTPRSSSATGGGGGSGAAGSTTNGGDGTNTYSSWATVTSTGVSGRYAAGGAGVLGTAGAGGGGASVSNSSSNNTNHATANTGSGGGGISTSSATGVFGSNGGSGIIIVRYTKAQVD